MLASSYRNIARFTHQEYADMHFIYGFCNGNARAVAREYQRRFPNRRTSDYRMLIVNTAYTNIVNIVNIVHDLFHIAVTASSLPFLLISYCCYNFLTLINSCLCNSFFLFNPTACTVKV